MGLLTILIGLVVAVFSLIISFGLYLWYKHEKDFRSRGIPTTGAGYRRMFRFLSGKISLAEMELQLYRESLDKKGPVVGYLDSFTQSAYYVTDLDLARHVYVKDFEYFVNRRRFATQKSNAIFLKMLIGLENDQWKSLRSKLSPTFTTGKIKRMYGIFEKSSKRMCDYLEKIVGPSGDDFDICEVYSKYAMDVIAGCAFGIDSKSFETEPGKNSRFEEMGKSFQFRFKPTVFFKFVFIMLAPKLADMLGIEALDGEPIEYFTSVIKEVIKRRRETGERQDDFLQLMLDAQEGLLKSEENSKETLEVMTGSESNEAKNVFNENGNQEHGNIAEKLNFDDETIIANCVLFLIGGFDTLQSLLIYAAYQLALDQDIQEKLYQEVKDGLEANDGKLSYDKVQEMTYMDLFINETLRFYPPAMRTERLCTHDYKVPGTDIVIAKGSLVSLPVIGTHHDPNVYENPEKFNPENFLPENKSKRHPYAFSPFGQGPRNCIGMRFALAEAKAVIAMLVARFKLQPCARTDIPPKFGNNTSLKPANGMWLRITPRN